MLGIMAGHPHLIPWDAELELQSLGRLVGVRGVIRRAVTNHLEEDRMLKELVRHGLHVALDDDGAGTTGRPPAWGARARHGGLLQGASE
uniref:Uncharacterized protein n=1 Tax=Arundo donax TaxID=35708 RepID=A0A0A9CF94_ARUDO